MAAISAAISRIAALFGEYEERRYERSIDMRPEDGCLSVRGVGKDSACAFTRFGIECPRDIVDEMRRAGRAPPKAAKSK